MKRCILELILRDKGGIYTVYHFADSNNLRVEKYSKKRGKQKKGALK